jgi:hypothetical protein
MTKFGITFKKTVYAILLTDAKTEDEAEDFAWRKFAQDIRTSGQILDWTERVGSPNYEVIIDPLGDKSESPSNGEGAK